MEGIDYKALYLASIRKNERMIENILNIPHLCLYSELKNKIQEIVVTDGIIGENDSIFKELSEV